ncbi:hypothetical protein SADUNF_Sadunf14G0141200 [Salix dunnii]|uniref:Uncharacterized protein n=1 Tax=Salix dunnii TaxID=1413687 RepID=A0A835JHZ6_9ROSI|nr:hypothetical protein SADUNF_Sadunf14G0141200 [Salix dunnii]
MDFIKKFIDSHSLRDPFAIYSKTREKNNSCNYRSSSLDHQDLLSFPVKNLPVLPALLIPQTSFMASSYLTEEKRYRENRDIQFSSKPEIASRVWRNSLTSWFCCLIDANVRSSESRTKSSTATASVLRPRLGFLGIVVGEISTPSFPPSIFGCRVLPLQFILGLELDSGSDFFETEKQGKRLELCP